MRRLSYVLLGTVGAAVLAAGYGLRQAGQQLEEASSVLHAVSARNLPDRDGDNERNVVPGSTAVPAEVADGRAAVPPEATPPRAIPAADSMRGAANSSPPLTHDPELAQAFEELLNDPDPEVRQEAAELLRMFSVE